MTDLNEQLIVQVAKMGGEVKRVDEKVEHLHARVDKMDNKLDKITESLSVVRESVASNKTNSKWAKRIILMLLGLAVGGGAVGAVTAGQDSVPQAVSAPQSDVQSLDDAK